MDPMAEIKASFFVECSELLESLEEGLLQVQGGDTDPETVNAVFRAVHSIKGGAGAFGLDDLVHFAHRFETVLDEVRSDRLAIDADAVLLFLKSADSLSDLVAAARDETPVDEAKNAVVIAELETLMPGGSDADEATTDADQDLDFAPMTLSIDLPAIDAQVDADIDEVADEAAGTTPVWTIRFATDKGLNQSGNEPLFLMRALAELGPVIAICDASDLPPLKVLDPSQTNLHWDLTLSADTSQTDIEEVFEFAQGLCTLAITKKTSDQSTPDTADLEALPVLPDLPTLPDLPAPSVDDQAPAQPATENTPHEAPKPPAPTPTKAAPVAATVRVDLERIDRLVNLVGELVINQAMLSQSLSAQNLTSNTTISTGLDEFQQLTRDIQDSVMAIRAQPVKPLFQRMSRIVREAAHDTHKKVRLVLEGEATEIDKTVIERLADPLTHMIRNAVDHGLETPEKREQSDKDPEGTIHLRATHRSGRVVIEIQDNGAGINRERVLSIAQSKGLVPTDAVLSDAEIDNLLFMPGFSTAKEISNLSGRGVGMDVVKRAIQSLGGRISIQSTPGHGSTFSISLPLTLAVLDGMVIEVSEQTMVVPLSSIVETLTLADAEIQTLDQGTQVVHIRGKFVPLLDLAVEFGYRAPNVIPEDAVVLFISAEDGEPYALVVDTIHEQRQVVIKGLADSYGYVPGVAAATILGDGKIALILDPVDLIARAGSPDTPTALSMAG